MAPSESNVNMVSPLLVSQSIMFSQGISSMWMGVERHCGKMDGRVKWMMQRVERCMVLHMEPDGMTDEWIMEQCWILRCCYSVKAERK